MLVICEDCAKKYNVDMDRIAGRKARFACHECGHMIIVEKRSDEAPGQEQLELTLAPEQPLEKSLVDMASVGAAEAQDDTQSYREEQAKGPPTATEETELTPAAAPVGKEAGKTMVPKKAGRGLPMALLLLLALMAGFLAVASSIAYLYFQYIPELLNEQIDLRTAAVASSFQGVVQRPLLVRNYLEVNKEAERFSQLPGVAYAAVINNRNVVIAGYFSDLNRFDDTFAKQVKSKGFPVTLFQENGKGNPLQGKSLLSIGNQKIQDSMLSLPDNSGSIHVGVYVSDIDKTIREAMISPLSLCMLALIPAGGLLAFMLLNRLVTRPLQRLTEEVDRISLGELDLSIKVQGPKEIRDLSVAFERMRYSIKAALDRLRRG